MHHNSSVMRMAFMSHASYLLSGCLLVRDWKLLLSPLDAVVGL